MKFSTIIVIGGLLLAQFASAAQSPAGPPAGPPAGQASPFGEQVAGAKADEVRVIASGALMAPLESVRAQADKATGKRLVVEYGGARSGLRDEILNGQEFEVALLVSDVNDELISKGLARGRFSLVRMPVGIGYAGDVPAPDVSTPAALKKTLLAAKGLSFAATGAGAPTANKVLSSLGIADSVKRVAAGPGPGPGPASPAVLAPGEYTISIFPASEIVSNKSVKYLGPVIDDFQVPVILEGVIGAHARDSKAAAAFIGFLQGPVFAEALKKNGMVMGK